MQCPNTACSLYVTNTSCTTYCPGCGTLCEAFPITDLNSLNLYKTQGCTIIVGDLYITNLPSSVSQVPLLNVFQNIPTIRGTLYYQNNLYGNALTFLKNLKQVNSVALLNNPNLLDARLLSLQSLSGSVSVAGCDRLCPARYPTIGFNPSDGGCTNKQFQYFFGINGVICGQDFSTFSGVVARAVSNVTKNAVSLSLMRF